MAGAQRGPRVRRRSAGAALVVAVFVLTAIWAGTASAAPTTVTVSSTPVTRPRPDNYIGPAFTYSVLTRWMSISGPVDPVLVGLILDLTPSGRPSLRIGGESADRSGSPLRV